MKIHLRQIPAGGSIHLEGEEVCPLADLKEVTCLGPLSYDFDAGVSENALWVSGSLRQEVELACVVCLEKFAYEIKIPNFAVHTGLHGPETIDLEPFVREDLLLNLPPYPHCDTQGGRTCPGATLHQPNAETTEGKRERDWGELDKLKL